MNEGKNPNIEMKLQNTKNKEIISESFKNRKQRHTTVEVQHDIKLDLNSTGNRMIKKQCLENYKET